MAVYECVVCVCLGKLCVCVRADCVCVCVCVSVYVLPLAFLETDLLEGGRSNPFSTRSTVTLALFPEKLSDF